MERTCETMSHTRKAFTLIELLVVIAIIALLVSILLPALNESRNLSRRVVCSANLHSMGQGFYQYAQDNKDMLPPQAFWGISGSNTYLSYHESYLKPSAPANGYGPITIMKAFGAGGLYDTGLITEIGTFYCPGLLSYPSDSDSHKMSYYIHPVTGEYYTSDPPGHMKMVRISYNYFKNNIRSLDKMGSRSFLYDLIHSRYLISHISSTGDPKGFNVLYGDGHVVFNTNRDVLEEELWGDLTPVGEPVGQTPDHNFPLLFGVMAVLGNNTPDLNALGGNYQNFVCNENPRDGAGQGTYMGLPPNYPNP